MKEGWKIVKIIDVATVVHGRDYKDVAAEQGYPVYGSGANVIAYANDYICEEGTTILGRKGTIDKPVFIEEKFWNIDTAFGIVAKECINKKYLYYGIKSIDWASLNPGGVKPSLTQKIVYNQNIPLPSLAEQERIVAYLDTQFAKIDAMKANAAKALAEAKALFQAALTEAMTPKEGWTYQPLEKYCKVQNGFAFDSKLFNTKEGTPLIRIRDVIRGFSETFTSEKADDVFLINDGDILIGMDGDFNVGEWHGGKAFLNQRVCKIIPGKDICPRLILYLLPKELKKINDKTTFSTVKHLSSKQVNKVLIPILSLAEQERIVTRLDALSAKVAALEGNYTQTVAECDALKQALLREVFE